MSKAISTIKQKREIDKQRRLASLNERRQVQEQLDFKSGLQVLTAELRILMRQEGVESVEVTVSNDDIPLFSEAVRSFELSAYSVVQRGDRTNVFVISEREIY